MIELDPLQNYEFNCTEEYHSFIFTNQYPVRYVNIKELKFSGSKSDISVAFYYPPFQYPSSIFVNIEKLSFERNMTVKVGIKDNYFLIYTDSKLVSLKDTIRIKKLIRIMNIEDYLNTVRILRNIADLSEITDNIEIRFPDDYVNDSEIIEFENDINKLKIYTGAKINELTIIMKDDRVMKKLSLFNCKHNMKLKIDRNSKINEIFTPKNVRIVRI